jgi:hypothetical protein
MGHMASTSGFELVDAIISQRWQMVDPMHVWHSLFMGIVEDSSRQTKQVFIGFF